MPNVWTWKVGGAKPAGITRVPTTNRWVAAFHTFCAFSECTHSDVEFLAMKERRVLPHRGRRPAARVPRLQAVPSRRQPRLT